MIRVARRRAPSQSNLLRAPLNPPNEIPHMGRGKSEEDRNGLLPPKRVGMGFTVEEDRGGAPQVGDLPGWPEGASLWGKGGKYRHYDHGIAGERGLLYSWKACLLT